MSIAIDSDSEFRALIRSIEWTKGLAFYFVVVDDIHQCSRIRERIGAALQTKSLRSIDIRSGVTTLMNVLRAAGPFASNEALFVSGFENVVRDENDTEAPLIRSLNASRDALSRLFAGPIVFVVPPHVLAALAAGAPDFFSTRSGSYHITGDDGPSSSFRWLEAGLVGHHHSDLSPNQRNERIAQLRESVDRLSPARGGPSRAYFEAANRAIVLLIDSGLLRDAYSLAKDALRDAPENVSLPFLHHLARIALIEGRFPEARRWLDQALSIIDREGDDRALQQFLELLAGLHWNTGELNTAAATLEKVIALAEACGDREALATSLRNLALIRADIETPADAIPLIRRAVAVAHESGNGALIADVTTSVAALLQRSGRVVEAEEMLREGLPKLEKIGDRLRLATAYAELGGMLLAQETLDEAEAAYRNSLSLFSQIGASPTARLPPVFGLFAVEARRGNGKEALVWLQRARELIDEGRANESGPQVARLFNEAEGLVNRAVNDVHEFMAHAK